MEPAIPEGCKVVQEGKARILYQAPEIKGADKEAPPVFYNPVQEFNRDISILAINTYLRTRRAAGEKLEEVRVLEGLAATGLRSIRFIKEIPDITKIVINDFDPKAVESIKKNLEFNQVDLTKVQVECQDANILMQKLTAQNELCDVVDLDPYGTAVEFLDAALRSLKNGGLLCATFTDAAVLCEASQRGTCFARYGSCSPRKHGMREAGLRVLLYCISQAAVKYRLVITPVLTFFSDFYFRVMVKVKHSPKDCLDLVKKVAVVVSCANCQYHHFQKLMVNAEPGLDKCPVCGSMLRLLGPIWNEAIHDIDFIKAMMEALPKQGAKTERKIVGLLTGIKEEIEAKMPPLGLYAHVMISEIKSNAEKLKILSYQLQIRSTNRAGLNSLGYHVMQSAMEQKLLKTDTPIAIFYDLLKHIKKHKYTELKYMPDNLPADSFRCKILEKEIKLPKEPDYEITEKKAARMPRFFPNPQPNWGPKARAHGTKRTHAEEEEKGGEGEPEVPMVEGEEKVVEGEKEKDNEEEGEKLETEKGVQKKKKGDKTD